MRDCRARAFERKGKKVAANLNQVQIIGRLGRDPEVRTIGQDATKIANLRVATSEYWRDKRTNERKEATEWHSVTVWAERSVEFCDKYLRKGDLVFVQGKLVTRKWTDQSNNERYSTEIHVRFASHQISSMEKSQGNGGGGGGDHGGGGYDDDGYSGGGGGNGGTGRLRERAQPRQVHDDLDDDIPF
jgi:single-strand DNA-binding protein